MKRVLTDGARTERHEGVRTGGLARELLSQLEPVSLTELEKEGATAVPSPNLVEESGPSVDWSRIADEYSYAAFKEYAINFSAGAWGVRPLPVTRAQIDALMFPTDFVDVAAVNGKAAETFGAAPDSFVLAGSTTANLAKLIPALGIGKGDVVLRTNGMHRAVTDPLHAAEKRGARVEMIDIFEPELIAGATKERLVEVFRQAMDAQPKAKALFLNHIMPDTGVVLPLEEICALARERGIMTIVDGALAPGQIDVDLGRYGCDVYAASLGKWLGGPAETGFLHVSQETQAKLKGTELRDGKDVSRSIERFLPLGAPSNEKYAGIDAALDRLNALGSKQLAQRIQNLAQHLATGLRGVEGVTVMGPTDREVSAGIVGFAVDGYSVNELGDALAVHGIKVHPRPPFVRVDANLNTTEADADRLIGVLAQLTAEKR